MVFKETRILIYIGLVAIAILVAYFLVWMPIQGIKENQKLVAEKETLFQKREEFLSVFKRVAEEYKKNSDNIKNINKILLPKADLSLILIQLEALAAESRVEIKEISFATLEKSDKGVGVVPVNIKIGGAYGALKNFLEAVSRNMNIMEVGSLIFKAGKDTAAGIYTFTLGIDVYVEELPKAEVVVPSNSTPETQGQETPNQK